MSQQEVAKAIGMKRQFEYCPKNLREEERSPGSL